MNRFITITLLLIALQVHGQAFKDRLAPLVEASCIDCHDADTDTPLNFEELGHDLSDAVTFRQWVKIFDRVESGEMPPKKKKRPDPVLKNNALKALEEDLRVANLNEQDAEGRVAARRLTRLEFEYTLQDILGIGGNLARHLPPENASAKFANVAEKQGISPVHIRSYLTAVDAALDEAIMLGPKPRAGARDMDYRNNRYSSMWFDRPMRNGGQTVMRTDDAYVMFSYRREPFVARSDHMGYDFPYPGLYRITAEGAGYQAKTLIGFGLYKASDKHGNTELIGNFEIKPGESRKIEVTQYFEPGEFFFPAGLSLNAAPDGKIIYMMRVKGARGYKGEGLAIKWLKIEGPLEETWPPTRTRDLLTGVPIVWVPKHRIYWTHPTKEPNEHLRDIVNRLAPKAFRRPVTDAEIESFVSLAKPHHPKDQPMHKMVRAPLRAMFSSPQFLFHGGQPGPLDDHALATRLSYFLWKSVPDEQLSALAHDNKLKDPKVLANQVNRMLKDPRSNRFVDDFLDGWLHLSDIDATTPDEKLYPEYGDTLRQAMLAESRLFFRELIDRNLATRNFIDSDFTFVNRRLAHHYGLPEVPGERMRRVKLPADSARGGLMTQASILKVTANGTLTSPVKRGHWVLNSLLGTPPQPPPPTISALEPDIRGAVTIRETLAKHRDVASCASCHQHIDPPGFALESFDPIGGFRHRYRTTGKGDWTKERYLAAYHLGHPLYRWGLDVDASGSTASGEKFRGIRRFRDLLLKEEVQVARNFVSQLITYATGAEVQFADRAEVERMLASVKADGYLVRDLLHAVVQSRLFLNK
jgi:hypothetical protein